MELFDQPSWGMTDFTQRINYRRALEGELERTIGKMTGVESAQVHLAMDETRTFRSDDRPKSASVVLRLRNGAEPSAEVVRGVQHLVASSVDAVESASVAVLDDSGRMLSSPADPGSLETLTSQQLGMQREVETYLEGKAQQIVDQVLGPGGARIKVAAQINFDRVERTVQKLDPDAQAIQAEQKAEIVPGPQGGAGSTNTNTTYENSRSMESFTGATGNVKRLSVAVVVDDRRVPKGDSTVAVPRTAAELAQIQTLVRNAVGLDDSRGDAISVVGMSFSPPPAADAEPAPSVWVTVADYRSELLSAFGLLIAAFVALRVLRSLRTLPEAPGSRGALGPGAMADGGAFPSPDSFPELAGHEPAIPIAAVSPASNRTKTQVVATVQERPDVAARLARAWLKEA
jgi:flagellar M-ring protein FliF